MRFLRFIHISLVSLLVAASNGWAQETTIDVVDDSGEDRRIERRLAEIFAEIDGLERVSVMTEAGVVKLSGVVGLPEKREQAEAVATRARGVVTVESDIEIHSTPATRVHQAFTAGWERLVRYLEFAPLFVAALIVSAIFLVVASAIWRREKLLAGIITNVFLRNFVRQILGAAVALIGLVFALELLDATAVVSAILGAAGVVGLAVGFAFKDTIENYIAGILLSIRQPFAPHDLVTVAGQEGHVVRLTSRATVLLSLDGNYVRIPNAKVFQEVMVNYSRNPLRRFRFEIGIGTDVEISAAQALAVETLLDMKGVENDPLPQAIVNKLGDSNVVLAITGWVDQRLAEFTKVRSEAIRLVKQQFEQAEFDMPEPIYRLRVSSETRKDFPVPPSADPPPRRVSKRSTTTQETADVTPDRHMIEQVMDERERTSVEDLLDENADQE